MSRKIVALVIAGGLACAPSDSGTKDDGESVDLEASVRQGPLPPMPSFPSPQREHLVTVSAGWRDTVDGSWRARAVICERPRALQLVAKDSVVGTIALFHLAPDGDLAPEYAVTVSNRGHPPAPAVQMGVLVTGGTMARAFQAVNGTAVLEELSGVVTGRFSVTLREVDSNDSLRWVGVFLEVPVEPASATDCAAVAEPVAPSDTPMDSTGRGMVPDK
jgi:hypothetical protein